MKNTYCYASEVPMADAAFYDEEIENCILHVQKDAIGNYRNSPPWNRFKWIGPLVPGDMKCGDINGDSVVNSADVVCIINIIKKGATETEITFADLNGDGVVNKDDVEEIVKIIMTNK